MLQKRKQFMALSKIIVLSFVVLFCMLPLINTNKIVSTIYKIFKADNEVELDNWEISTVFYDSTVNDGKTPLTEINWDASDGGCNVGETRTITVQINYKNSNTIQDYERGELKISLSNLLYSNNAQWKTTVVLGANDNYHTGYDWTFEPYYNNSYNSEASSSQNEYSFVNEKTIEKNSNLEGTIQVSYILTPKGEANTTYSGNGLVERFDNECLHELNKDISVSLNSKTETISGNDISFSYRRLYIHPWKHEHYSFNRIPAKLTSADGLPSNYSDYYWVKYDANGGNSFTNSYSTSYPRVGVQLYIEEEYCDECIVLDENFETKSPRVNNVYRSNNEYIVVGYPKSIYNDDNNNTTIQNDAILYGDYEDGTKHEYNDEEIRTIDLKQYEIVVSGNLYSFSKIIPGRAGTERILYENLIGEDTELESKGIALSHLSPNIKYTGKKYDIKIGDDLLFITGQDNNYKILNQGEYYFSSISFPSSIKNGNSQLIEKKKYDVELYIKKGNNDYELFSSFKNGDYQQFSFSKDDNISAFYFRINDMEEGITSLSIGTRITINNAHNISYTGKIINLGYMKVYIDGEMQNIITNYNFPETIPINDVEEFDIIEHGEKVQRDYGFIDYFKYDGPKPDRYSFNLRKVMTSFVQNENHSRFETENTIYIGGTNATTNALPVYEIKNYSDLLDDKYKVEGWNVYDLLPEGMKLESSSEEIIDSLFIHKYGDSEDVTRKSIFFDSNGNFIDKNSFLELVKNNSTMEIINNYRNSNRTYIHLKIDLSNTPVIYSYDDSYSDFLEVCFLGFKFNSSVSYDSYLMYGNSWSNRAYLDYLNKEADNIIRYIYKDDGLAVSPYGEDLVESDINNNGIIDEGINKVQANNTIIPIISTNQDVQVSVQSDKSNYDTGKVDTSNDSTYIYKLRVRTGSNEVTNLVIYNSLENYSKDSNMEFIDSAKGYHKWKGEFQNIDTSYAESKGYTVRAYYSESETPGSLKDDDSWKLYTDSVDKSKVKSFAFEYLDSEGNPAVLPANSLTYVLIKMKSPADENIKTLAYNGCWTEWNAIDSLTGNPVDFITGINSNIVKVALPKSVEPVDIDFRVDKYWNDHNNEKGLRPNTINIQVVPDGDVSKAIDVPLGSTNVDSANSNHWYTTIQVPKYDEDGNTIDYTVREDEIRLDNGYKYTPEIDEYSITNTLMKEIGLKKIWKDGNNSDLTRPSNVTFNVKQNGNNYRDVVITGDYSSNEWTKTITVPVFDSSNNEYSYSIDEEPIQYYSKYCEGFTCTNTLGGDDSIHITKIWIDDNNSYETRPDSISVVIYRNGTEYKTVELTDSNNWEYIEEVPKYDDNGNKYTYTIEEENVDEYDKVTYNQNTYEITNTLKTNMNIVITKNWIDDNNSNNTRPSELVVTLLRNGEDYREITLSGDSNTWTSIVEVPKYDDNQKKYKYSIKEINVSEDYSDITYDDDLTITNKLKRDIDLTIKKKWIDHNNEYLTRPEKVNIKLFRNDEEFESITLTGDSNTWESTIKDVPMYDDNGKKYTYTIREDNIDKYSKVTYDQSNLEVTNELTDMPKVTLYFTVVNGYVDPKTGQMKYDEFGLKEILKAYNVNPEDEYIFKFELENVETKKRYEGKLSTKGILEFKDIPYGEYKAVVGKDKLFEFVDMMSIEEVQGVSFKKVGNEGYITIKPTGKDIIFGAKIVNKIKVSLKNPKTGFSWLILLIIIIPIVSFYLVKNKKEY